jgi:hypothetical protein
MKKTLIKLLGTALAMVLLLGLAMPAQAREVHEVPTSFDFTAEARIVLDTDLTDDIHPIWAEMILDVLSGEGILMNAEGTVYTEALTATMFYAYNITLDVPMLGVTTVTLRYWFDVDITDLNDPTVLLVFELEMPMLLRMMLNAAVPELSHQFFVLDLSEFAADAVNELDAQIVTISPEEVEEIMEQLRGLFERAAEGRSGSRSLSRAWGTYMDINFNYDFGSLANGYFGDFDFEVSFADGADAVEFGFFFSGEITNVNNAQRPVLPVITPANSLDLVSLIDAW